MVTETDIKKDIAGERRQLTDAVATLRGELDQTAERGRRIGVAVGAAAGAAVVVKMLVRLVRGKND